MELFEKLHLEDFQTNGRILATVQYGNGHINATFLLVDATGSQYILQKINKGVFKKPEELMENIIAVTAHQRRTVAGHREALTLIPLSNGKFWTTDESGDYWRMYRFISDSICFERSESQGDFRESAVAFGRFQRQLADFPASTLHETIPLFHDTPSRYAAFKEAVKSDVCGRAKNVRREIDFALEREAYASVLVSLQASGGLPLRVTHNDAKLNNVLFDRDTRRALCVIDLDTVMPGLSVNDFGDSIRFGASTAEEDERDLDKVNFSIALYNAYTEGYLSACGESLTACEREHLRDGAKMMTLECGVRFLADYLAGDVYFQEHNLDRCRTQFKLVKDMEEHWERMAVK